MMEFFKRVEGFKRLTLSEPNRHRGFHRLGWAHYDSPAACLQALNELNHQKIKEFSIQLALNKQPSNDKKIKITSPVAAEESRITIDLEQAKQICLLLDKEKDMPNNPLFASEYSNTYESLTSSQKLDQLVTYMRDVHNFCYYCGEEYEDEDELHRKCGHKHLRGKKKESDSVNVSTDTWAKSLDEKIKNRLNSDSIEVESGRKLTEKKLEKFSTSNVNRIDEEKYRCGICNKLFCGESFVRKHLSVKHPDQIEEVKKQAIIRQFSDNYTKDPKKITSAAVNNVPNFGMPMMNMQINMPMNRGGRANRGIVPWQGNAPFFPPFVMMNNDGMNMRNGGGNRGRGSRGGRGGRGGGNARGNFTSPVAASVAVKLPPPDLDMPQDPRGIREYIDLDAPTEDSINIDYGTPKKK